MKQSLACYNLKNEWQEYLSAELPTFGLVADQLIPGIVDGSHRYVHDAVHTPHENEPPTYDNVARDNVIPAMKFRHRNLGHLHDAAVRIRRGIGHVNGVTIPWHALSKDVLTEELLEHVRKLDLPYKNKTQHTLADLVSIKNGDDGED